MMIALALTFALGLFVWLVAVAAYARMTRKAKPVSAADREAGG